MPTYDINYRILKTALEKDKPGFYWPFSAGHVHYVERHLLEFICSLYDHQAVHELIRPMITSCLRDYRTLKHMYQRYIYVQNSKNRGWWLQNSCKTIAQKMQERSHSTV